MTDNQQLLAEYARNGSDAAFRELVTRYIDLVHSTALRLVEGDAHRAQDVAQTVFLDLARKARTLPADVSLGGWLHRDTCLVAGHVMRGERRRQSRERQAVEMNTLQNHAEADFSHVAPILDEAINELGEADRTAILLRFFEQHDFRTVGQALGSNEDAARMRVTRALEKLATLLKRRGVTASSVTLGVALGANAVQAAPVGLAVTISTAAALAGTSIAATATATATKAIAMTTLQKTIIGATLAAAVGTGIYEARQASSARAEAETLRQQQAALTEQLAQRSAENERLSKTLTQAKPSFPDEQKLELLRLRGEVARFRYEQGKLAADWKLGNQHGSLPEVAEWKPELLANAGKASPRDAVQTFLWAMRNTNLVALASCVVPDTDDPPSDEAIQSYVNDPFNHLVSQFRNFKLLSETNINSNEVRVELLASAEAGGFSKTFVLRNILDEWRLVIFTRRGTDGKASGVHLDLDEQQSP